MAGIANLCPTCPEDCGTQPLGVFTHPTCGDFFVEGDVTALVFAPEDPSNDAIPLNAENVKDINTWIGNINTGLPGSFARLITCGEKAESKPEQRTVCRKTVNGKITHTLNLRFYYVNEENSALIREIQGCTEGNFRVWYEQAEGCAWHGGLGINANVCFGALAIPEDGEAYWPITVTWESKCDVEICVENSPFRDGTIPTAAKQAA